MFRCKTVLQKQTANGLAACRLRTSPPATHKIRPVGKHAEFARFMSSNEGGGGNPIRVPIPLVVAGLAAGIVYTFASLDKNFKERLIKEKEIMKTLIPSFLKSEETKGVDPGSPELSHPVQTEETDITDEHDTAVETVAKAGAKLIGESVVINVMDTPTPSQIDFIVGKKAAVTDEEKVATAIAESDPEISEGTAESVFSADAEESGTPEHDDNTKILAEDSVLSVEVDDVSTPESVEVDDVSTPESVESSTDTDVKENETTVTETIIVENVEQGNETDDVVMDVSITEDDTLADSVTQNVIPEDVIASPVEPVVEIVSEILPADEPPAATTELESTTVVQSEAVAVEVPTVLKEKLNKDQQVHVLQTAYENLKIILDDTITTKTSAAGMLKGYLSRLGQELMVAKDEPALVSAGEGNAALDHSIQESIDLVRSKETDLKVQVQHALDIIHDVREDGSTSEIADKTEELITSSNESLSWAEFEITMLSSKVKFLSRYQKQLEESSGVLKAYLGGLVPDLIKLVASKEIDIQDLSYEDALLLLSLKRIELTFVNLQESEKEQDAQFESILKKEVEDALQEANGHVNTTVAGVVDAKDNELTKTVNELKESQEGHLRTTLDDQNLLNEQNLHNTLMNRQNDLQKYYSADLQLKLDEEEAGQYGEIRTNLFYLDGIDSKAPDILELEKKGWADMNLMAAINTIHDSLDGVSDNGRTKDFSDVFTEIRRNCSHDETVSTILATVPEDAMLGVVPLRSLIDSFPDLKTVCKRYAMVQDESESALSYVFSFIKSIIVRTRSFQNTEEMDPTTLGQYGILERAEQCLKQGHLEEAARLMSQLNGVPRKLADNWLKEVRLYVETKQAVDLLKAYVGSQG